MEKMNELVDKLRSLNLCKLAGGSPILSSLLCQQEQQEDVSNRPTTHLPDVTSVAPPVVKPKLPIQSWTQSSSLKFQQLQRKTHRLLSDEEIIKRLKGYQTIFRRPVPVRIP